MGRIDPQFGPDFRPGYNPDHLKGDQPIRFVDDGPIVLLSKYQSNRELEDEKRRTARGIIRGVALSVAAWATIIGIVAVAVWGV
jgi:hypothetical protein